jgi:carboxyl-terminal processing protease
MQFSEYQQQEETPPTPRLRRASKKGILKKAILIVVFLVLLAASYGAGLYSAGKNELAKEIAKSEAVYLGKILNKYSQPKLGILAQDVNFDLFWEVWDTLEKQYVEKDKLNEKELFYGALRGMVEAVKDPYTVFMDPKESQDFAESLSGTFEGIGAEIGIRKEILTIVAPLPETPAEKAGLRAGDKIYAINGESTAGFTVEEAVRKIRGSKGTTVTLTISRDGVGEAKDFVITRGTIIVKSVKTAKKDDIFVITINSFNNDTASLFNDAVEEALKINPKAIILDLRNNPGGYLETAIDVASEWVEEGIIVTEKFDENNKNEFQARGRARLKDIKTIVLVNEGSASASEIVAGALKDYGKGKILGKKTFGKGSVQTVEDFKDGSSVKITVAKWLTPKGNNINELGIAPDEEVDMTTKDYEEGKDPQMDKALESLK